VGSQHLALGRLGENRAAKWYIEHGYCVLARNWRCRLGEIDLIASRGDVLVICEVKTRRNDTHGQPYEAVTAAKQRRLRHLAAAYLADQGQHRYYDEIRFDVVSILGPSLQIFQGAF
jgi:putative endonuclease